MRSSARSIVLITLASFSLASAEDIDGVQPAALDQPRINLVLRRSNAGAPLSAKAEGVSVANVEAFLDTGASGILLSDHTATQLGVQREHVGTSQARFEDIGVGGSSEFAVSEPLVVSLADSAADTEVDVRDAARSVYTHSVGPLRAQVGPIGGGIVDSLVKELVGDLDVAGMPAMVGMVVVMDPGKVNKVEDKIHTTLLNGLHAPATKRHIRLSYTSFEPFTKTTPTGAAGPLMTPNPFIGPSPVNPTGDATPPIYAFANGKRTAGSWLLDTGAATSMISLKQAAALGITYAPGTFGTSAPKLLGVPANRQFTMTIGGIGGSKKSAGCYLDGLRLFTTEGQPLTFLHAPVLVADITVKNTVTGKELTLDGVFGMNYLVASAKLDEDNPIPAIGNITPGAFSLIVFDQPRGLLGLN